eukprot:TRINITY_DN20863_c0_g2_i1.p1 TRINITY_DN20863_c0_g2~~TRINITY_DN20863_c0_g2_i1.p1  ORF type:complete len:267 (-),score=-16.05 TRINITY_DN20863_c0_g2_i1:22-822(-)
MQAGVFCKVSSYTICCPRVARILLVVNLLQGYYVPLIRAKLEQYELEVSAFSGCLQIRMYTYIYRGSYLLSNLSVQNFSNLSGQYRKQTKTNFGRLQGITINLSWHFYRGSKKHKFSDLLQSLPTNLLMILIIPHFQNITRICRTQNFQETFKFAENLCGRKGPDIYHRYTRVYKNIQVYVIQKYVACYLYPFSLRFHSESRTLEIFQVYTSHTLVDLVTTYSSVNDYGQEKIQQHSILFLVFQFCFIAQFLTHDFSYNFFEVKKS